MKIFGLFGKAAQMLSKGDNAEGALVNKRHPNDVALPYGPTNYGAMPYGPMNYVNPKKSKTDMIVGALGIGAAALPIAGGITQLLAQRDAGKAVNASAANLPNQIVLHADTVSNTTKVFSIAQNLIHHVIYSLYTPLSKNQRDRRDVTNTDFIVSLLIIMILGRIYNYYYSTYIIFKAIAALRKKLFGDIVRVSNSTVINSTVTPDVTPVSILRLNLFTFKDKLNYY